MRTLRRGLVREDALALSRDDETGRDMARRAAIDACGIDIPVAGRGVGVARRFHDWH